MKLDESYVVVVKTLSDIKQAIKEFTPDDAELPKVNATIESDGKTWQLSAPAGASYREMLIEGFDIIKRRLEILEKPRDTELNVEPINIDGHMWLDDLIERRLGGVRDGLRVRWDITDGTFYFDPYSKRLTKCHEVQS